MEVLTRDVLELIGIKLEGVSLVFWSTSHPSICEIKSNKDIRNIIDQSCVINRGCLCCRKKVPYLRGMYVILICSCLVKQKEVFPHYHLRCLGIATRKKGLFNIYCPVCRCIKPAVICDWSS